MPNPGRGRATCIVESGPTRNGRPVQGRPLVAASAVVGLLRLGRDRRAVAVGGGDGLALGRAVCIGQAMAEPVARAKAAARTKAVMRIVHAPADRDRRRTDTPGALASDQRSHHCCRGARGTGNRWPRVAAPRWACAIPTRFWAYPAVPPPDQIRTAYRKLAKTSHPDLHPGDKKAEERFKEASAAYELLSDEEKRRQFDRGEIDATGAAKMRESSYRDFAESPGGARYAGSGSFENAADLEDVIQDLFGGRGGGRTMRMRGGDVGYRLEVGLGSGGPRCQDPDHAGRRVQCRGHHPAWRRERAGAAPEGQGLARHRWRPTRRRADRDPDPAASGIRAQGRRPSHGRCRSRWARRCGAPRSPCRRCTARWS